jgi:hypothetical protein
LLLDPVDRRRVTGSALLAVTELRQPPNESLITIEVEEGHDSLVHAVGGRHGNAAQDVADVPSKSWRITRAALLRLGTDTLLGFGRHRCHTDESEDGKRRETDSEETAGRDAGWVLHARIRDGNG